MTEKIFLVRDYMHETVSIQEEGATLKDIVKLMMDAKRNGIFIVDEHQKVKGIISSWDIIEHIVPDYLETDKHLASFEIGDVFAQRALETAQDSIDLFMTKKVHVVHEDSTIMEAATMLSEFTLRQLPVVTDEGVLVGSINRTDIKQVIAEILGIQAE